MAYVLRAAILALVSVTVSACGGGSGLPPPRAPSANAPAPQPGGPQETPQALYESGRYQDVLDAVGPGAPPPQQWFAASSAARLGRPAVAETHFARLAATPDPAWAAVANLGRARISGDPSALDAALGAALPFDTHPFVQLERGRGHLMRGEYEAAAAAFDRALTADPRLAYAFYYAAIAYQELEQSAVMASRLETFLRLAPDAPEEPEASAILSTAGR